MSFGSDIAGAAVTAAVRVLVFVVVVVVGLTLWAIDKSQERTACYRAAQQVCEQPGPVERVVRSVLG